MNTVDLLSRRPAAHDGGRRAAAASTGCAAWTPTDRCCAAVPRTRTCSSRRARLPAPSTPRCPDIVQHTFDALAELTGRRYGLVDYQGARDAERGHGPHGLRRRCRRRGGPRHGGRRPAESGCSRCGCTGPSRPQALLAALPSTVRTVTVLDRVKEPGAPGEPLYLDVVAALRRGRARRRGSSGGRYGLSSKEFTPAMAKAVLDDASADAAAEPLHRRHRRRRLALQPRVSTRSSRPTTHGCGRCSTGWARTAPSAPARTPRRSSERPPASMPRRTSSTTPRSPARSPSATCASTRTPSTAATWSTTRRSSGVHQWVLLDRQDVLEVAAEGATVLVNTPYGPDEVWDRLPVEAQEQVLAKRLRLHCVNASAVARRVGMAGRINTVMQTCFFDLAGVLPRDEALRAPEGRRPDHLRQARQRRRPAEHRRHRRRERRPPRGRRSQRRRRRRSTAAHRSRRTRRTSCSA